MLKISLAQINPCVGALQQNTIKIIESIAFAQSTNRDLIIFPELCVTGYPPEDLLLKPRFIIENIECLRVIAKTCKKISAIVGFVNKDSHGIYNACAFLQKEKIKNIYHKTCLPNYGVFDEKRYFKPGKKICVISLKGYRLSLSICEDVWNRVFIESLKKKKLDCIVNISGSPFYLGKIDTRKKILISAARTVNAAILYCNLAGGQDELVFDGGSMVISKQGKIIIAGNRFAEDDIILDFDKTHTYKSIRFAAAQEQEVFAALSLGLRDYVHKNKFQSVVIGISGGIDSALTAAIACTALGKENVYGLLMPSRFNSRETFNDGIKLCENLGIRYHIVSIENIFDSYLIAFKEMFAKIPADINDTTEENVQARIRGALLMAFSNKIGALVLNTGNKSEVSCGYCTLYGDMVGGFSILKDVDKTLVYALSKYFNQLAKKELIPLSIIARPPSAELKPNQKDEDSLGPYAILDPILKLYIQENWPLEKIVKRGFKLNTVKRIVKLVDSNEYKRRQSPLGVKITSRAFGKDRRMPITDGYKDIM